MVCKLYLSLKKQCCSYVVVITLSITYIIKLFCNGGPANSSAKTPKASEVQDPSAVFPQAKQE